MTINLLKSSTAIVLSLSLAVPHMALAQTANTEAEQSVDQTVDTSGMTEAEIEALKLRKQLEKEQAEADAAQPAETSSETAQAPAAENPEQDESLLDKAVGAVTDGVQALTDGPEETQEPASDPAPDPEANTTARTAPAQTEETTPAPADTEAEVATETDTTPAADPTAQAPASEPETDATETEQNTADAPAAAESDADDLAPATAEATTEPAPETAATNETEATETAQQKPEALPEESDEDRAQRQAQAEAAQAEAQATSMAASAGEDAAAQVVQETVTEETSRSSTEKFSTKANAESSAAAAAPAATANEEDKGLDTVGKIALFGLGALAVGELLKNGSEVVSNSGDRVVVQQADGSYKVYKNDDELINRPGTDVKTYAFDDGSTRTVATRENGVQIETIRAADGTVLRRTRILPDGRAVVLFDDTQVSQRVDVATLPQTTDPRGAINFRQAQEDELRAALEARAPQNIERTFSLGQVRNINAVRGLVPEIAVDNINFQTGSSVIRPEEAEELAELGTLMRQQIEQNPGEVFLIEGHTDAVGSASYNLALSDRRAESVALALTEYFDVPPENMVVQGYGESDLKVRTLDAEQANRRAAVRRITQLLTSS